MTTYTVINRSSGLPELRNAPAWQAAEIVLTHDGHDYEVRRVDDHWQLFVSQGSRNTSTGPRGMTAAWDKNRLVLSYEQDEAAAYADIGRQVVTAGWNGVPEVMTDADFDAMLASIEAEA
jgi:hypothetical protein